MRRQTRAFLMLSILGLIVAGCAPNAPHDNPVDPSSPGYKSTGVLTGRVLSLSPPYQGIAGALVMIQQTGQGEFTSSDGSFSFQSAPSGDVTLIVTKASYLADTISINILPGRSYDEEVHIDALPLVSDAKVITGKIDQWWPGPVYSALVSANITDPDGIADIDSIYVQVDSLSFTMNYSVTHKDFEATIDGDQLPNQDLQWLIGKELNVFAIDKSGGRSESPGFYVTRIIEAEPYPQSPTNGDTTTTASPTFKWNPPIVSFDYTYQLQIVSLAGGSQTVVWSESGISSATYSFAYQGVLPSGTYFWTAAVVDNFGNSSRSKEAPFVVP